MLISVKGAKALDKQGGRRTAELIRRAESGLMGTAYHYRVRDIVQVMLVELDPPRFRGALEMIGDAEAAYQAFFVLYDADQLPPSYTWQDWKLRRMARRYDENIRHNLVSFIVTHGDTTLLERARETLYMFPVNEQDRITRDKRLGYVA